MDNPISRHLNRLHTSNMNQDRIAGVDFDWHNPHTGSKLALAVRSNDLSEVNRLLKKGMSPDAADNRGYTALHEAAVSDDLLDITKLLVKSEAYIEHRTVEGETPLFLATKSSSEKTVEFLLLSGCQVDCRTLYNKNPLHEACTKQNYNILAMLLKSGANINARDQWRDTPIFYAIQFQNLRAVEMLLKAGCDTGAVDYAKRTPLQFSCMVGNVEIFEMLIKHCGPSKEVINQQNPDGWTLLMEAVQSKNCSIIEKLISYGADASLADSRGILALHLAAHCGQSDIFKQIIRITPKDAIEKYASSKENLRVPRSLTCLLIDVDMYEGLKFLMEYGVSDDVLACPVWVQDRLEPPVSYLMLHAREVDDNEKVKYLELLLSNKALIDPECNLKFPTRRRSVEAVVLAHEINHADCNCELMLSMLLNKGADPNLPPDTDIPAPFVSAMLSFFVRGLALLLAHSNQVDPESLLFHYINQCQLMGTQRNPKEDEMTKFLVWASTDFQFINSYLDDIALQLFGPRPNPKIQDLTQLIKAKASEPQSLKRLARLAIRKQSWENEDDNFRNIVQSLCLPTCLKEYLCYADVLSYSG